MWHTVQVFGRSGKRAGDGRPTHGFSSSSSTSTAARGNRRERAAARAFTFHHASCTDRPFDSCRGHNVLGAQVTMVPAGETPEPGSQRPGRRLAHECDARRLPTLSLTSRTANMATIRRSSQPVEGNDVLTTSTRDGDVARRCVHGAGFRRSRLHRVRGVDSACSEIARPAVFSCLLAAHRTRPQRIAGCSRFVTSLSPSSVAQ